MAQQYIFIVSLPDVIQISNIQVQNIHKICNETYKLIENRGLILLHPRNQSFMS